MCIYAQFHTNRLSHSSHFKFNIENFLLFSILGCRASPHASSSELLFIYASPSLLMLLLIFSIIINFKMIMWRCKWKWCIFKCCINLILQCDFPTSLLFMLLWYILSEGNKEENTVYFMAFWMRWAIKLSFKFIVVSFYFVLLNSEWERKSFHRKIPSIRR